MRLIFLFLLIPSFVSATTIVIFKSKDGVYIAADSKSFLTPPEGGDTRYETTCKVHKFGDFTVAIAGHDIAAAYTELTNNYSIGKKIRSFQDDFVKTMALYLRALMEEKKKINKGEYESFFTKPLIQTAFIYYSNDTAFIDVIQFSMKEVSGEIHIIDSVQLDIPSVNLGTADHINAFTEKDIPNAWKMKVHELLVELVKLEAKHHQNSVGEPIDAILVRRNGYKWLTPKRGNCLN